VRTFGLTFSSMPVTPPAVAGWHQLVYAQRGVLTVRSEPDSWVVPPHRAMWVPSGVPFVLETSGEVALRALYIHQNLSAKVPRHACAVNVSPLLREVVLRAVKLGALLRRDPIHVRLAGVLLDELEVLPSTPLQLPMPRDPRAARAVTPKRYFGGAASSDARCVSSSGGRSMGKLVSRAYRPRSGREQA
jgi:hypothetical protein